MATYVAKQRPSTMESWQKLSDTTGRGFGGPARKVPGMVSNTTHGYREELPRPTMDTLLTQKPASLDHQNRYFTDNKKMLEEYVVVYDGDKTA